MSVYLPYIPSSLVKLFQSADSKKIQQKVGVLASLGKTASFLGGIIAAIALLAFSILSGGIFRIIGILLFAPLTLLAIDTYFLSQNASKESEDPKNFIDFQNTFPSFAKKVVKGTLFWDFIWKIIEAKANNG